MHSYTLCDKLSLITVVFIHYPGQRYVTSFHFSRAEKSISSEMLCTKKNLILILSYCTFHMKIFITRVLSCTLKAVGSKKLVFPCKSSNLSTLEINLSQLI